MESKKTMVCWINALRLGTAICVVLLSSQLFAQTCVPAPPDLISWWLGDVDARDIAGANHGTLVNGTTLETGLVSQAFSFDGLDDYVSVPDSPDLKIGTGDFTIGAWLKRTTTIPHRYMVFDKGLGLGTVSSGA